MEIASTAIENALANAREQLLGRRTAGGHWEGELSSSALSTATATFALAMFVREKKRRGGDELRERCRELMGRGLQWLIKHQNEDGGWGDTIKSISNISTTALCWAALSIGPAAFDSPLP